MRRSQRLSPLEQVEAAGLDLPFDWTATGDDPQFLVRGRLLPGWYMLEVELRHQWSQASSQLYYEVEGGFSEAASVQIASISGRLCKRLFRLSNRPRAVRFDPANRPGHFSIRHFRIAWLPPFFAHDRLLRRIVRHRAPTQPHRVAALRRQLRREAQRLQRHWVDLALEHYDRTFPEHRLPGPQVPEVYRSWLAQAERREPSSEAASRISGILRRQPLVSVVVPVYNTRPDWLAECIESVLRQSYPHWQLCIADDASSCAETRAQLAALAAQDARIDVQFRRSNGGISAATNSALALARGELVAFLDHDDRLAPNALFHVAKAVSRSPGAQILYSDEDKLDAAGARAEPHFKPDWNPDLALAQNYVNHLAVYRMDLIRELGGLRQDLDGSQDHDLLLQASARVARNAIVHIPRILYHWRASDDSSARDPANKPHSARAGLASVSRFLADQDSGATACAGTLPNTYRVSWPLPARRPLVSILLPTRDRLDLLKPCVDRVLADTDYDRIELLIVDNASRETTTLAYLKRLEAVARARILRSPGRFNFSAIINAAAGEARGELLLLLNNDVVPLTRDWLSELVRQASRPEIGCVGAMLLYPDGRIQHAGVILGIGGVAGHAHKFLPQSADGYYGRLKLAHNVSAVTAACLMVRRAVFEQAGGLDAEHLPVAFNDVDFCLRVSELGYRNLWTPYAILTHHESASRGNDDSAGKQERFAKELAWMQRRWGRRLSRDPAYNPNLTLQHEDFSLR